MKTIALALSFIGVDAANSEGSPIQKVLELIANLEKKIIKEGEEEQKGYVEFSNWCEDTAREKTREIKNSKLSIEDLESVIEKSSADFTSAKARIVELSDSIAEAQSDLEKATKLRKKEARIFKKVDAELAETIDTLIRAQSVIEKALNKPALLQETGVNSTFNNVIKALGTIVDSAVVGIDDKRGLSELLQKADSFGDLLNLAQVKPGANVGSSGGILQALEDLQNKAEDERDDVQKKEMKAKHAYEMLKQGLETDTKDGTKALEESKQEKRKAKETQATAEGELGMEQKDLNDDQKVLSETQHDCMARASEFEISVKSRDEELHALASAKKIVADTTGGAENQTYTRDPEHTEDEEDEDDEPASFVQTGAKARLVAHKREIRSALKVLLETAKHENSTELSQLSAMISSRIRVSEDPFSKVKDMITQMIAKLHKEAEEEAAQKAFCDKEMGESKTSREDKQDEVENLTSRIDKAASKATKLRRRAKQLSGQLVVLSDETKKLTSMRQEEKAVFDTAEKELSEGLEGIRLALKVLRDYYAKEEENTSLLELSSKMEHAKGTDSATGIISMLELAESDFSKGLADRRSEEEEAVAAFEKFTQEAKVTRAEKSTAIKASRREAKQIDKMLVDIRTDRQGVQDELNAVLDYIDKLRPQCEPKVETYEEKVAKREREIEGLKTALDILENEAASVAF